MIHTRIVVELGSRSYPIYSGSGMLSFFAPTCTEHSIQPLVAILTDQHVAKLHLQPLLKHLKHFHFEPHVIVIPAGERQKSLSSVNSLVANLLKAGIDRSSTIIALGGGVIGDLGGFVAATYQRGIQLIQVPTTLLAQVDSAIGGKVAVNHPLAKNMIGAFYQPQFVWEDVEYLTSLPLREIVCGVGEVIKYAIIRDAELFGYLETSLSSVLQGNLDALEYVQQRCAAIKAEVVSTDEREHGERIILNCGHTIGHALEAAGNYRALKHGEAILLGLAAESWIASELGMLSRETYERINALIKRVPIKASLYLISSQQAYQSLQHDKKRLAGKIRFVLPTEIGKTKVIDNVEPKLVQKAIRAAIRK